MEFVAYHNSTSRCDKEAINRALDNINSVTIGRDLTAGISINGIKIKIRVRDARETFEEYQKKGMVASGSKPSLGLTDTFSEPNTALIFLDLRWIERERQDLDAILGHELAHVFQNLTDTTDERGELYQGITKPGYAMRVEEALRRALGLGERTWERCKF